MNKLLSILIIVNPGQEVVYTKLVDELVRQRAELNMYNDIEILSSHSATQENDDVKRLQNLRKLATGKRILVTDVTNVPHPKFLAEILNQC